MTESARVILGDCLDVLPSLAGEPVACIITDPPYGIDFRKGPSGNVVAGRESARRITKWTHGDDRPFDPNPWLKWPCVFFGADHFSDRLPAGGSWHVWDKRAYSTLDDSFADLEFIWSSMPGKSEIIEHLWKGVLQASEKGRPKYHVNQKPVRVMRHLVERFTKPGDLVVDPYAGSGSTLLACVKSGRRAIGIDIDPENVATARRRLAEAATPLFDDL